MLKACKRWFPSLKWTRHRGQVTATTKDSSGAVTGVWKMERVDDEHPYRMTVEGARNLFAHGATPEDACRLLIRAMSTPDISPGEAVIEIEDPTHPPELAVEGLIGSLILSLKGSLDAAHENLETQAMPQLATTQATIQIAYEEVERARIMLADAVNLTPRHSAVRDVLNRWWMSLGEWDGDALRAVKHLDALAEPLAVMWEAVKTMHMVMSAETTDFQRHEAVRLMT